MDLLDYACLCVIIDKNMDAKEDSVVNDKPFYIERPLYLQRIMPFVGKDIMKILVGQRRVGKSYLLYQLMDRISSLDPKGQPRYTSIKNYMSLPQSVPQKT